MPNSTSPALLSVATALARILASLQPTAVQRLPLADALGYFLADDIKAKLTLPPHDVSSMDGFAVRAQDVAACPASLTRVGESAAGHPWPGRLGPQQAVRIFTGAYVPDGADCIVIQENVAAASEADGSQITVLKAGSRGRYIRPAGLDITAGDIALAKGSYLSARRIALAIAAGETSALVCTPPRIGILSTGDELVPPGTPPGPGQIISSNAAFLTAFVKNCGAHPIDLGIAIDAPGAVQTAVSAAHDLDMVVTTGGASVGTHDHIVSDLAHGKLDFWKIAMRPGKPLIFGHIGKTVLLGLPGNPVSTGVTAAIFVRAAVEEMLGLAPKPLYEAAILGADLPKNGKRLDFMRASLTPSETEMPTATPFDRQDSSMLAAFAHADCLIMREIGAPPTKAGETVKIVRLGFSSECF